MHEACAKQWLCCGGKQTVVVLRPQQQRTVTGMRSSLRLGIMATALTVNLPRLLLLLMDRHAPPPLLLLLLLVLLFPLSPTPCLISAAEVATLHLARLGAKHACGTAACCTQLARTDCCPAADALERCRSIAQTLLAEAGYGTIAIDISIQRDECGDHR